MDHQEAIMIFGMVMTTLVTSCFLVECDVTYDCGKRGTISCRSKKRKKNK